MQLINKTHTRKFILLKIKSMRPHLKHDRVSAQAIARCESEVRNFIVSQVEYLPSVGKTVKFD